MSDLRIFSTAEWGAVDVNRVFPRKPAEGIVVHNTESANRAPLTGQAERNKAFSLARQIQSGHLGRGWADTGQHFTISRGGLMMEGRHGALAAARLGKVVSGAHACKVALYNTQWYGIEIEGDNRAGDKVTIEEWAALIELCSWLCIWGGVDSSKIIPHKGVKAGCTDCPGKFAD